MTRILIIEDERAIARAIAQGLRDEGFTVDIAADGVSGLQAAREGGYGLLLLDLQLPGLPGLELCRQLRAAGDATPILMLTARDTVGDIVTGLDAGASDYLIKPFVFEELLARVRAQLRTAAGVTGDRLVAGDVELDCRAHRVRRGGVEVPLTPMEMLLLEQLLRDKERVVPRERLAAVLWGAAEDPGSNALEVHVASLRRKLGAGAERLLRTVRGVGYVLREGDA